MPICSYFDVDHQMIPIKEISCVKDQLNNFENERYDTCFSVKNGPIRIHTKRYSALLESFPENDPFIQVYTPDHNQSIAVEPMTGIADAFNNQIGLHRLASGEKQEKTWQIQRIK